MSSPDISQREKERRQKRSDRERQHRYEHWIQWMSAEDVALVNRIIHTLVDAEHYADPRRSTPLEGQRAYRRPDSSRDEGAATRWVRDWIRRFHRQTLPVLAEFDARVEGSYKPRERGRSSERVLCVNDNCEAAGKRIPKYVGPDASIQLVRCPTCGQELVDPTTLQASQKRCWNRGCPRYGRTFYEFCNGCT